MTAKAHAASRASLPWVGLLLLLPLPILAGNAAWIHLGTLALFWALIATSLNVIWGMAGQFSIAQLALAGVGAYAVASLGANVGWTLVPSALIGVLIATVISALIGSIALRLKGFYFAIMTLAFVLILVAVASNAAPLGRATGLSVEPNLGVLNLGGLSLDLDGRVGTYVVFAVLYVVTMVAVSYLSNSRLGRGFIAIREDELLAESVGVPTTRYKLFAFAIAAVIASSAGAVYSTYVNYISPETFGFGPAITVIVILVIGGRGRPFGPIVGAATYMLLVEVFRFADGYRSGVFGVALILVVLFAPEGLSGLSGRLLSWSRRRSTRTPTSSDPQPRVERPTAVSATGDIRDA